jgi:hypothetical protein
MSEYTASGRKKPTFKIDKDLKKALEAKGHKVLKGPVYKRTGPSDNDKGPGYYVQYEKRPGEWAFLGRSKDIATKAIG